MKKESHVELGNARQKEQRVVMERIITDSVCPFCRVHLEEYHPNPILFETDHWIVTTNAWPYHLAKYHFLVIAREHISHSAELPTEAWADISKVFTTLSNGFDLDHGTFLMRFGDMSKTGATVKHLHFQIIQSDPAHEDYDQEKGLWTRIG